jgi:hypothetical protein
LAPHFGHFFTVLAENGSIFSKRWPHFSHLYSKSGKRNDLLTEKFQKMIARLPIFTRRPGRSRERRLDRANPG